MSMNVCVSVCVIVCVCVCVREMLMNLYGKMQLT